MNPPPFKLERYFAEHEFTARYLLCSSDPESMSIDALLAYEPGALDGLKNTWLGYTEYPRRTRIADGAVGALYEYRCKSDRRAHGRTRSDLFVHEHPVVRG